MFRPDVWGWGGGLGHVHWGGRDVRLRAVKQPAHGRRAVRDLKLAHRLFDMAIHCLGSDL